MLGVKVQPPGVGLRYETTFSTGNKSTPCDSGTPATSAELGNSAEGRRPVKQKEDEAPRGEEVGAEKGHKASFGNEASQQSQAQTVIKLSFSEEQSLPESTHPEESSEVSKEAEHGRSEVFSFEEIHPHSDSEEEIEPSTDEELRLWRYPPDKGCKEEESAVAEEQRADVCCKEGGGSGEDGEKGGGVVDIQDGECCLAYAEISGCSEVQEDERPEEDKLESESCPNDSMEEQSALNGDHSSVESWEGRCKGALTGDVGPFTNKSDQEDVDGCTHGDETYQQSRESGAVGLREGGDLESDRTDAEGNVKLTEEAPLSDVAQAPKGTQTEDTERGTRVEEAAEVNLEARAESSSADKSHGAQELELHAADGRQGGTEGLMGEKAEGGESSKKVTFTLQPEFIDDCASSASDTSVESTAEMHVSGERRARRMGV